MAPLEGPCRGRGEERSTVGDATAGPRRRVAHLGDGMLIEIFSRLPTRPLFRFRCLSQRCRAIVDGDVYPPLARPGALSAIFFSDDDWVDGNVRVVSRHALVPSTGDDPRFRGADMALGFLPHRDARDHIAGCCNGLLLMDLGQQRDFVVCNPATRRWVAVPKPSNSYQLSPSAALVFDPQVSPFFTIARLGTSTGSGGRTVKRLSVFRSENGRWEDRGVYDGHAIRGLVSGEILLFGYGAMACDGALFVPEGSNRFIARFDLVTGVCSTMDYPDANDDWPEVAFPRVFRGRVHLAMMVGTWLGVLQVWMLKNWRGRGDKGWEKKHQINVLGLVLAWLEARGEKVCRQPRCRFLGFHPHSDAVFLESMHKIFACDLLQKRLEEVCDLRDEKIGPCSQRFFPYTPCLLGCREDR